jgi:hypothetical protein
MADSITLDEVLAELSRLKNDPDSGPEGFTMAEMAGKLGLKVNSCQGRLKDLVVSGKVEMVGKRAGVNIAGGKCLVPVYRLRKSQS